MKNRNTKVIAAGVGILALCQGGYIYNQSGDIKQISEQMEVATSERGRILSELDINKITTDSLISKNSELTRHILEDEKKIAGLNSELKAAKLKLEKLQQKYNLLKSKSESINDDLSRRTNTVANSAVASDRAKKREAMRMAKDSIERARLNAIATKRSEAERARLEAVAAKKGEAERLRVVKELDEKAKLDAIAAKKAEAERIANEKKNAERARLEEMIAKKAEDEKAKIAALTSQKSDAEKSAAKELVEKNRIEALIQKKKEDLARARQAISDRNSADAEAISKGKQGATTVVSEPEKKSNVTTRLENQNPQLADKLYRIKITGLKSSSFRYLDEESKEEEETDDSSEVSFFKVSFTIPQNFVVRASDRNYYFEVRDENNKLVGDNVTETIDGQSITYCHRTNIKYKNRQVRVNEQLFLKGLKEGTYTIKVYDRKELINESTVVLN